ncbi:hypothetical protein, partial [Hydrogenimonas sp.]
SDTIHADFLIAPAINLFFPSSYDCKIRAHSRAPLLALAQPSPFSHLSGNLSPYVLVVKGVPDPLPKLTCRYGAPAE